MSNLSMPLAWLKNRHSGLDMCLLVKIEAELRIVSILCRTSIVILSLLSMMEVQLTGEHWEGVKQNDPIFGGVWQRTTLTNLR